MRVLVDTPVWSLALRRKRRLVVEPAASELGALITDGRAALIGAIRQELLSGIREQAQFEGLRAHLSAFSDIPIAQADYEEAASFFNQCRAKGVQGSNTDFLICAVAVRNDLSILTTDHDFSHFATVLPIRLHESKALTHPAANR